MDDTQYLFRVDWTPNSNDNVAVRYLADDQLFANQVPQFSTLQFPGTEVDVPSLIQNAYINWTRTFSAEHNQRISVWLWPVQCALQLSQSRPADAPPQFLFGGTASEVTGIGPDATFPQGRIFNNYQLQDTVSHTVGNHTFRAGFDVMVQRAKQFVPINTRGTLTFTDAVDEEDNVVSGFGKFPRQLLGQFGRFCLESIWREH